MAKDDIRLYDRTMHHLAGFCFTFWAEFEGYLGGHFDAYLATFLRRIRQGGVSEFVPVELTAGLTP